MKVGVREAIERHEGSGRRFSAAGVESFALDAGAGEPVVLVHGVPSSSYLYRKVAPLLAERGLRAVSFDFPGLGLAERPADFDYTWSGLARWMGAALDALEVQRCHLVVHDIGGPIGIEWGLRNRDRVITLTALNTLLDAATFRRPWTMRPFATRGAGEAWLRSMRPFAFRRLFRLQGLEDSSATPADEISAYYYLLKRGDGGRAFLRIMRGFELTREKEDLLCGGLAERPWPAQLVWGDRDPALGEKRRRFVQEALGVEHPVLLPARHFLQEDQAPAVAEAVAGFAGR